MKGRTRCGALALAVALPIAAAGCEDSRGSEEATTAVPTGAGSMSGTGDPTDSGATGTDSDAGSDGSGNTPRLDVGAGDTEGATGDPDSGTLCEENVDIVFVMDVSTSMDAFLDKLAIEIATVDQALAALDLPGEPHYGLVVFVDDVALLGAGAPYPDVASLQTDFLMWSDFTSTNQQTSGGGYNSTWPENSLDALWVGATGFQWRPADTTLRMIIHTTDDTFWEGPSTQNGEMIQHDYASTVDLLQENQIRVFSFTALIGAMCNCEDVSPGWSTPYMGDPPIPEATDGGVFNIDEIIAGTVSLADAIEGAIDQSICDPYDPVG